MSVPARKHGGPREQNRKPPPAELMGLPDRLEEAMRALGLKKAEVARRSGVGADLITGILDRSKLAGIQAANVIRLARGIGISAGWLLAGEGTMTGAQASVPILTPGTSEFEALATALQKRIEKKTKGR